MLIIYIVKINNKVTKIKVEVEATVGMQWEY